MDFSQVIKFNIPDPNPIEGYTKLDYIEATGNQYIDTGFYPKPTTCVEMDHEFTNLTVQQRTFGTAGNLYYQIYINGAGRYSYAYQNSSGNWVNTQQTVRTERHIVKLDGKNGKFQLDGIYSVNLSGAPTNTANYTLWINDVNNLGSPSSVLAHTKIYSCKIWDNGTLVRDFIPVKDSNNIAGLYDLVNDQFYTSETATDYVAGNEIYTTEVTKLDINSVTMWEKPAKVLSSITLVGETTALNRGATYSFGGAVIANYTDGSKAYVTSSSTFTGYNMSTAGTYTVTASYTEDGVTATATYTLTVNKAWSALWSGSKTITWNLGSSTPSSVDVYTSSFANNSDIRITFTMSNKIGTYSRYQTNGTATTTKPSSPYRISSFATGTARKVLSVGASHSSNTSTSQRHKDVYLYFSSSNKKFILMAGSSGSGGYEITSGTLTLTVTKIEQYY